MGAKPDLEKLTKDFAEREEKARPLRERLKQIEDQLAPLRKERDDILRQLCEIYHEAYERGKRDAERSLSPREGGIEYLIGYADFCGGTQRVVR